MRLIARLLNSNYHQLMAACLLYAAAVTTLANVSHSGYIYPTVLLMSLSTTISKVSVVSFSHDIVGKDHTSVLVGLNASLTSIARLLSPIVAGYIIHWYGVSTALYLISSIQLLGFSLCFFLGSGYKSKSD